MKAIKGNLFLNNKLIGTVTDFKLNLKEIKMKRKHVIEQQALKIEELEDELEYWQKVLKDKNKKFAELHHKLSSNTKEYEKLQKLSQSAVNFISTLTHDIKIN